MKAGNSTFAHLEADILAAHERGARTSELARLYRQGGDLHLAAGRTDEAYFAYTQAYVYALDAGLEAEVAHLLALLRNDGRET